MPTEEQIIEEMFKACTTSYRNWVAAVEQLMPKIPPAYEQLPLAEWVVVQEHYVVPAEHIVQVNAMILQCRELSVSQIEWFQAVTERLADFKKSDRKISTIKDLKAAIKAVASDAQYISAVYNNFRESIQKVANQTEQINKALETIRQACAKKENPVCLPPASKNKMDS